MQITEIISAIIDSIRDTGTITSITKSGSVYTCFTANTKKLKQYYYVVINSKSYQITEIVANTYFKVSSTTAVTGTTWTAEAPYYYSGTPIAIDNTLKQIGEGAKKYPIIVLFETIKQKIINDTTKATGINADLQLFFMDNANYRDWQTSDHYDNVIEPLQDYVDLFLAACNKSKYINFFELKDYNTVNHAKWGIYVENKGHIRSIFTDDLSGIELQINLPIMRHYVSC